MALQNSAAGRGQPRIIQGQPRVIQGQPRVIQGQPIMGVPGQVILQVIILFFSFFSCKNYNYEI